MVHTLSRHGSPLIRFTLKPVPNLGAEFAYAGFSNDDEGAAQSFYSSLAEWNRSRVGLNEAFTALDAPLFFTLPMVLGYRLEERVELYLTDGKRAFFLGGGYNENNRIPRPVGWVDCRTDYHHQSGEPLIFTASQPHAI